MRVIATTFAALILFASRALAGDGGIFITAGTGVSTRSYVHFYIEDASGRRTGQLPNGRRAAEIPGTADCYGTTSVGNDATGERGSENVEFQISDFPAGDFKLILLPLATTSYFLRISIRNDNFSELTRDFAGYASSGTPIEYHFEHHPTASSPTPVAKQVSFDALRRSIQIALTVGELGDSAFVSRLDKVLLKAADFARQKDKSKQSADLLDQFIHRLDSAFKKDPDPDDGDDPQDKKATPIINRFATQRARDSLSEDARILIRGLGETPAR